MQYSIGQDTMQQRISLQLPFLSGKAAVTFCISSVGASVFVLMDDGGMLPDLRRIGRDVKCCSQ